jgi:D-hexose-6-phosphate mutarotase
LNFVIVGAGPTGVEMAGALGDMTQRMLKDLYKDLDLSKAQIFLVDAYIDKVDNFRQKLESSDAIRINSETDRVYLDTSAAVVIHDSWHHRNIRVEKSGSVSTVVWNPWVTKAKLMPKYERTFAEQGKAINDKVRCGFMQKLVPH